MTITFTVQIHAPKVGYIGTIVQEKDNWFVFYCANGDILGSSSYSMLAKEARYRYGGENRPFGQKTSEGKQR
jgi:hypothetical protein